MGRLDEVKLSENLAQTMPQAGEAYHRLSLGPVTYRSFVAADWDYTITSTAGGTVRHRTRAFVLGGPHWEISLWAPADVWDANLRYFTVALETFQLAP